MEQDGKILRAATKEAISKTSRVVIPAKPVPESSSRGAGIQSVQGLLDCPIKSGNDIKVALRAVLLVYSVPCLMFVIFCSIAVNS